MSLDKTTGEKTGTETSKAKSAPEMCVAGLLLDMDGTLIDTWNEWGKRMVRAYEKLADIRGIPAQQLMDETVNVPAEQRLHSIRNAAACLPSLRPKPGEDAITLWKKYEPVFKEWDEAKQDSFKLFYGLHKLFEEAKEAGTKIIVYTDAAWPDAVAMLFSAGVTPEDIDLLAAQPATSLCTKARMLQLGTKEKAWLATLGNKLMIMDSNTMNLSAEEKELLPNGASKKPCPLMVQKILQRMHLSPEEAIIVGDQPRDALSGKLNGHSVDGQVKAKAIKNYHGPNVRFAWANYGVNHSSKTLDFYQRALKDRNFRVGVHELVDEFKQLNLKPDITLHTANEMRHRFKFVAPSGKGFPEPKTIPARRFKRHLRHHRIS